MRYLALIPVTSFLFSPLSAFASEPSLEASVEIPIYFFSDSQNGLLGILPISKNSFIFAYATSSAYVEIGLLTYKNGTQAPATTTYPTSFFNQTKKPNVATTTAEHIFADGRPVATIEQTTGSNPIFFWNHQDHLNSTVVVSDINGYVQERVEYLSFIL